MAGKVTVACKMPNGLILRIFKPVEIEEAVLGGGMRKTKRFEAVGEPVHLKGYLRPNRKVPQPSQEAAYELTHGVDDDFMKTWMGQNKDSPLVTQGIILVHAKDDSAESLARENEKRRSGFEALDPDNLPSIARNVTSYEKKAA